MDTLMKRNPQQIKLAVNSYSNGLSKVLELKWIRQVSPHEPNVYEPTELGRSCYDDIRRQRAANAAD